MRTCRFRMFPYISKGTARIPVRLSKHFCTKGPNDEIIKPVTLAYATYENQDTKTRKVAPVLILHGYLASKRNWVSICKKLLDKTKPARKIMAVDLRNHGDSPHSIDHTNSHIVEDIRYFVESFQLKTVALMGHSFGGMTGMIFALLYPDMVEKLIVVDISPRDQRKNLQHVWDALDAISQVVVPAKIPMSTARSLIDQQLVKRIPEREYRSFLLTQLIQREDGNISWRFNVDVIKDNVLDTGSYPEIRGKVFDKPVIFIGGTKSDFMKKKYEPDTKKYFPSAEFQYVEGAGHVVHADKPEEFVKICCDFLNKTV